MIRHSPSSPWVATCSTRPPYTQPRPKLAWASLWSHVGGSSSYDALRKAPTPGTGKPGGLHTRCFATATSVCSTAYPAHNQVHHPPRSERLQQHVLGVVRASHRPLLASPLGRLDCPGQWPRGARRVYRDPPNREPNFLEWVFGFSGCLCPLTPPHPLRAGAAAQATPYHTLRDHTRPYLEGLLAQ